MRILVTGGCGLVGRYVVDKLAQSNNVDTLDVKPSMRKDCTHFAVDILDLRTLQTIVRDYDAVVHLAGIPHPLNNPAEEVFRINTLGTFNILESCTAAKIKRLVFMSSESTLGFAFSSTRIAPLYLPIDEDHPLRPQDPYGMSKLAGELLCRGYSARSATETVCLRAPWIWVPEEKERKFYRQLIDEYPKWYKNLWAFIHVEDVVDAVVCALTAKLQIGHDIFFISAGENWTGKESRELARQFYPETRQFRSNFKGSASFITSSKVQKALDFIPSRSASDIFR
jgi:UDP-glucose 4-epimerase